MFRPPFLIAPRLVASESAQPDVVGYTPDPLIAIAYTSVPRVPFSDRDLSALLFAARRWNARAGVTGRLVVLEDDERVVRFLQWIEGPAPAMRACFERIEADNRHGDIEVRFRGDVPVRRYPGWDMAIEHAAPAAFDVEVDAIVPTTGETDGS